MHSPVVSIILPAYNRAAVLPRAIKSVMRQTVRDFELIIIDDASTDKTAELLNAYSLPQLRILRNPSRCGAAAARNEGIKIAGGTYIAFIDSDDEWLPHKLQRQIETIKTLSTDYGAVYSDLWQVDAGGSCRYYSSPRSPEDRDSGYRYALALGLAGIGILSILIRRKCLQEAGMFDQRFRRYEDLELMMRISRGYKLFHSPEPLARCYLSADSLSADNAARIEAEELLLRKYYDEIKNDRVILAKYHYWIGTSLCQNGEMNKGRDFLKKSRRLCPQSMQYAAAVLLSFLGKRSYKAAAACRHRFAGK